MMPYFGLLRAIREDARRQAARAERIEQRAATRAARLERRAARRALGITRKQAKMLASTWFGG